MAQVQTFIENKQLALPNHSPRQSNDLPLTDRKVAPSTGHSTIERDHTLVAFVLHGEETGGTKRRVQRRVVELVERIEVTAEGATQQLGLN